MNYIESPGHLKQCEKPVAACTFNILTHMNQSNAFPLPEYYLLCNYLMKPWLPPEHFISFN